MLNNRYLIEDVLGEGGMGAVYRAIDTQADQPCAVKEFRLKHLPTEAELKLKGDAKVASGSHSKEEIVTREKALSQFRKEAALLAGLNHPNLPKVTDYFMVENEYYLVMTLIEGKNAATVLASLGGKPLPERAVQVWIRQVMEAIIHCHSKGIIHRDIKPANIILTVSGNVYLVDFGIAKEENPSKETSIGARVITPGYSPPEQYSLGRTDVRSDIYSLGATMYAMLTGSEPMESINRLMGMEMPEPRAIIPEISPTLAAVVTRSMALKPEERFQTVAETYTAVFSKRSRPKSLSEQRKVILESVPDVQPSQASGEKTTTRSPATADENAVMRVMPELSQTSPLVIDDEMIDQSVEEVKSKDQETQKGGLLQGLFGGKRGGVADENDLIEPTVSSKKKGSLEINLNEAVQQVLWAPRGKFLAILSTNGVYIFDQQTVKNVTRDDGGWSTNYRVAFSSDETLLAVGFSHSVQVWNLTSGQKLRDLTIDEAYQIMDLLFLPHGALLASGISLTDGTLKVWEMQSRREMLSISEKSRMIGNAKFSKSGKYIAVCWMGAALGADSEGMVKVWNMTGKSQMGTMLPVVGNVVPSFEFSPDEKKLAIGTGQAMHRKNIRVTLLPITKGDVFEQDHNGTVGQVAFSPDGGMLLTVGDDSKIKVWALEDRSEMLIDAVDVANASCAAYASDGRTIAIGTSNGTVYIRALK